MIDQINMFDSNCGGRSCQTKNSREFKYQRHFSTPRNSSGHSNSFFPVNKLWFSSAGPPVGHWSLQMGHTQ